MMDLERFRPGWLMSALLFFTSRGGARCVVCGRYGAGEGRPQAGPTGKNDGLEQAVREKIIVDCFFWPMGLLGNWASSKKYSSLASGALYPYLLGICCLLSVTHHNGFSEVPCNATRTNRLNAALCFGNKTTPGRHPVCAF